MVTKKSAGVASEVNLRNPLHAGDKAHKQGGSLALKPKADVTRGIKQRYQSPHKKTGILQNLFKNSGKLR